MTGHAVTVFMAFFAIMNPVANTAVFAGGVLVFLVGYHMLQGSASKLHTGSDDGDTDIATSPLSAAPCGLFTSADAGPGGKPTP